MQLAGQLTGQPRPNEAGLFHHKATAAIGGATWRSASGALIPPGYTNTAGWRNSQQGEEEAKNARVRPRLAQEARTAERPGLFLTAWGGLG